MGLGEKLTLRPVLRVALGCFHLLLFFFLSASVRSPELSHLVHGIFKMAVINPKMGTRLNLATNQAVTSGAADSKFKAMMEVVAGDHTSQRAESRGHREKNWNLNHTAPEVDPTPGMPINKFNHTELN